MDGYCRRPFRAVCAALAVLLLFSSVTAAWAQEARSGARVMEWYVTGDSVLVYVQHSGEGQSAEARVGTEGAGNAVITGTDGDVPVVTWLLVDNSLSIVKEDRAKLKQLLTDVVAGSASGERFNLCTFNTGLNVILQDSRDYVELKGKIEAIEHVDQDAFLVDALAEILDAESGRESQEFVRIVVISDGMDVNPEGLTKDELTQRLRDRNVPIYTLGCKRNGNEQALKEMYSLSRMTNAQSWSLTGLEDTLTIAQALNSAELPVCAQVTIPEVMRDGSSRG
ncbi:MAG: VWA domain-containing protein, partial [Oscillospiraceae bacterium]|nr:VWA domain-containing protein [Oscillospiraceae bacterium]